MRLLGILLMLAGAALAALAQTNVPGVRKMSLEDCLQSALEKNLDLRIARYNPPMALADLQTAKAGYDPNFSVAGAHNYSMSGGGLYPGTVIPVPPSTSDQNSFNSSLGGLMPWGLNYSLQGNVAETYGSSSDIPFDVSSGSASISLTQPLLKNFWIDQTRLNVKVARNRIKYSELGLKQTIMSIVTTVEQAYYDLIYDRENVTVQEKAVELATQLVVENKKRVEVGALAPLDEKQAEAQAASSLAVLIAARSTLAIQENTVKQLVTDDYAAWQSGELQPTAPLTAPVRVFDRQISWSKGLTERPDLLQAKLDVERQGITLKYNRNQLFPELDLVGSYGQGASGFDISEFSQAFNQIGQGSRPFYSYGAQLIFPIGNDSARAAYKKSKLGMEQYLLTLKKLEQTIMAAIDNDIKQAQSSFQQVAATRAAREYAADALDAEQKKLESGKSTTYTVLQMQRDLTTARGNEIQALAAYNKALAQLSLDEGSTLQRLGINIEVK
ncbi:MAG: TolC family protein [Verrucomicrobiota bacterium]|jgi:outer membrane protein TolC